MRAPSASRVNKLVYDRWGQSSVAVGDKINQLNRFTAYYRDHDRINRERARKRRQMRLILRTRITMAWSINIYAFSVTVRGGVGYIGDERLIHCDNLRN